MRTLVPALIVTALAMCSYASPPPRAAPVSPRASAPSSDRARSYDTSKIAAIANLASLVPADVRARGVLRIGMSPTTPPAEFVDDKQRTRGYDVDLGDAIGRVLGIRTTVIEAPVTQTLAGLGTDYDVAISSLTITAERTSQATMITYLTAGSSFGVRRKPDPTLTTDHLCGLSVGVTDDARRADAEAMSTQCLARGDKPITVVAFPNVPALSVGLLADDVTLMYASSVEVRYAGVRHDGAIQHLGGVRDAHLQGVAVAKDDPALATCIQQAMQNLMDTNVWERIATAWGIDTAVVNRAIIATAP